MTANARSAPRGAAVTHGAAPRGLRSATAAAGATTARATTKTSAACEPEAVQMAPKATEARSGVDAVPDHGEAAPAQALGQRRAGERHQHAVGRRVVRPGAASEHSTAPAPRPASSTT